MTDDKYLKLLLLFLIVFSSYAKIHDKTPALSVLKHIEKKGTKNIPDSFFHNKTTKIKFINTYKNHSQEYGKLLNFELLTSTDQGAWRGRTYKLNFEKQSRVYNFVYVYKKEVYSLFLLNIFDNWELKDDKIFNNISYKNDHLEIVLKNGITRRVEKDSLKNVMIVTFQKVPKIEIILKDKSLYYSNPKIYSDLHSMQLHVSEINCFLKNETIK